MGAVQRRRMLAALALVAMAVSARSGASATAPQALQRIPIHMAVAAPEGRPVADRAHLEAMVARAEQIFEPAKLSFELESVREIDGAYARLESRRDRHALAAELHPGVVNVFIAASLRDVDDPRRLRQGVHWRPTGARTATHYVIVSAGAVPEVLAHELGHYFGNHRHSETPGNIMSYIPAGEPFFDEGQLRVIARHVRRFVRTGELALR